MQNSSDRDPDVPPIEDPGTTVHPDWIKQRQYFNELDAQDIELDEKAALSGVKVWVIRAVAWFFVSSFFVIAAVLFVHYLGPKSWHWLSPLQISNIERIFGGSGAGYLIFALARDYLPQLGRKTTSSKE